MYLYFWYKLCIFDMNCDIQCNWCLKTNTMSTPKTILFRKLCNILRELHANINAIKKWLMYNRDLMKNWLFVRDYIYKYIYACSARKYVTYIYKTHTHIYITHTYMKFPSYLSKYFQSAFALLPPFSCNCYCTIFLLCLLKCDVTLRGRRSVMD